jgi:hypothetical protein
MPALLLASNYTRSTTTLEDLSDRVLGDLGLRNNNLVTSGDIMRWANEAQMKLARDTRAFHVMMVSGTTSGTAEYPLPDESTGRALTIEEVIYDGRPLTCVSQNWLFANNFYWETEGAGTPMYYYQRGFSTIGLYPCPDTTDTDILQVRFTALPPEVTAPEDQYYVPHGCEDGLVSYCCLKASIKDAFGEGNHRIPIFREEWQECCKRAMEVTASVNELEKVRMGENASFYDSAWNPFFVSANTVATPLS